MNILDSPPYPPCDTSDRIVDTSTLDSSIQVILPNVPSSTWTYGCAATSAGMLFGYYDRTTHPNMYTGPCNGGVCPLVGLGQGSKDDPGATGYPVAGSCYIIATENGFDGITTTGHADAFYTIFGATGDPASKTWALCTADYLGTNQWKWNYNNPPPPPITANSDGATTYWTSSNGAKLHDYIPAANCGMPQTSFCHGCKLFAQSRGYTVTTNYNQLTDNQHAAGFTFNNFKAEIDAGRPVVVHVVGHTMLGLGYDDSTTPETIYIHDTWVNTLMQMTWGGQYAGMTLRAVTVIQLQSTGPPVAEFTWSPQYPDVGETVTFDASSSYDPDGGNIVQYAWDLDENVNEGDDRWGKIVTWTYPSCGTYTVKLWIKDDEGETGIKRDYVTVPCEDTDIEITYPKIGHWCTERICIPVSILEQLNWGVVRASRLKCETETTGLIDYVKFHAESLLGEEDDKTDYDPPFECTFRSDLPSALAYTITATAYYNNQEVADDVVNPICFWKK